MAVGKTFLRLKHPPRNHPANSQLSSILPKSANRLIKWHQKTPLKRKQKSPGENKKNGHFFLGWKTRPSRSLRLSVLGPKSLATAPPDDGRMVDVETRTGFPSLDIFKELWVFHRFISFRESVSISFTSFQKVLGVDVLSWVRF